MDHGRVDVAIGLLWLALAAIPSVVGRFNRRSVATTASQRWRVGYGAIGLAWIGLGVWYLAGG